MGTVNINNLLFFSKLHSQDITAFGGAPHFSAAYPKFGFMDFLHP